VEAVARKLLRRDIVPDVAGLCALGQQVSDHVAELLLRPGDVLTSRQECREFGVVVPVGLVRDEGVGVQHSFEPLASAANLVSDFGEMFEVVSDLTFVPGDGSGSSPRPPTTPECGARRASCSRRITSAQVGGRCFCFRWAVHLP
jgi:hypothetical protein